MRTFAYSKHLLRACTFLVGLLLAFGLNAQTVTKSYNAPSSVSVDGCGSFCNSLPGLTFTANDFTQGCEVTSVIVSVTWAKTDGSCTTPGGGNSFHDQSNFRLDGPARNEVLAQPGTWTGGANIAAVTTTFDQSAVGIPSNTPVSGTFQPNNGNLSNFVGDNPVGTWTLRAGDNGVSDPMCIDSYSITVTASDQTSPQISCPQNFNAIADPGQCAAIISYTVPTGTDNCVGATTARTSGLGSGSSFPVGTTTESYTVTDAVGLTASCTFVVTVVDNQNPTISCPSNISVNADSSTCGAVYSYNPPLAADNCGISTLTQTSGFNSGATFPAGTTTNTFIASDSAGNTATCSFSVTVVDVDPPTASCPNNLTVSNDPGQCSAVVSYSTPSGTDNCNIGNVTLLSGIGSGGTFPIGVTTETWQVADSAGNTATCSFTVTVQSNLNISASVTNNVLCAGASSGSASVNLLGGCPSYSYNWSNGGTTSSITGVPAGMYIVGVTDGSGFTVFDTITITEPTAFVSSVVGSNVTCNGGSDGSVDLSVSGGIPPYTYLWSNGATSQDLTGLTGGTYSVNITDSNGCTQNQTFIVVEPAAISSGVNTVDESCTNNMDGSIDLTAFGGTPPYTFVWSNGATTEDISGLAGGTYSVTVTDSLGCTYTTGVTIATQPDPMPVITQSSDSLFASPLGSSYQWFESGNAISGATNPYYVPPGNGNYTVTVSYQNGCSGTSNLYSFLVGVDPSELFAGLTVYPNPTDGLLYVESDKILQGLTRIELRDALGRLVRTVEKEGFADKISLDLNGQTEGLYFLILTNGENQLVRKVILN